MKPTKQNTMEAIYLQSMTDFITWVDEKRNGNGGHYDIIIRYKNFLKQPLQLGFFVPCDENGNVLKEPKRWNDYLQFPDSFDGNKEWGELYNYELAKEKVLFEDCVEIDTTPYKSTKRLMIDLKHDAPFRIYNKFNYHNGMEEINFLPNFSENVTVEYLVQYSLKLTESAIKQIGL